MAGRRMPPHRGKRQEFPRKGCLVEDVRFVAPYAAQANRISVRASGLARAERRRFKSIPLSKAASRVAQRGPMMMNNSTHEFEGVLGKAALALWPDFPRGVQETLFETAVGGDIIIRNHLASYLHNHHPKTAHPAKPTQLA
jgi:hypothetical protein